MAHPATKRLSLDANVPLDLSVLRLAFDNADLPVVAVVHPRRLLRAMR